MHKILLNSVLLPPIGSGGIRPKLPRQTPLGHNSPCFFPLEDRLGSGRRLVGRIGSGVRVSVSFRQKYPPGSVLRCPTPKKSPFSRTAAHIFVSPGDAPANITQSVAWMERQFNACQTLAACTYLYSIVSEL